MIDTIINKLENKGCIFTKQEKEQLKKLSLKSHEILIEDLKKIATKYLDNEKFGVNNISIGIFVKDIKDIIEIPKVKEIKLFDIASITKLFTLKIYYYL